MKRTVPQHTVPNRTVPDKDSPVSTLALIDTKQDDGAALTAPRHRGVARPTTATRLSGLRPPPFTGRITPTGRMECHSCEKTTTTI
jgi:hypothetical protein